MNRMKVFLLLAVMIGFSSCQSRSKQNIEQEVEVDSLSTSFSMLMLSTVA